MAYVYIKSTPGSLKRVKNLGWLLRNWRGIESLEWTSEFIGPETETDFLYREITGRTYRRFDGLFCAYFTDGRVYVTDYASFSVWKSFINRPVFRGLVATVNGIRGEV